MSRIKLKVCGMRDAANILAIGDRQPDFMGFIFYDKSPRFVGGDFVIPKDLNLGVKRVGVFVNADFEEIMSKVKEHNLDLVQLHGDESTALCAKLQVHTEVIKAFSVHPTFDFRVTEDYESAVDYFLFDAKGTLRGGNGVPFNWELLKKYEGNIPFFLSGGVDVNNITNVSELEHPRLFAIDINSGIEVKPGLKDINKYGMVKNLILSL